MRSAKILQKSTCKNGLSFIFNLQLTLNCLLQVQMQMVHTHHLRYIIEEINLITISNPIDIENNLRKDCSCLLQHQMNEIRNCTGFDFSLKISDIKTVLSLPFRQVLT